MPRLRNGFPRIACRGCGARSATDWEVRSRARIGRIRSLVAFSLFAAVVARYSTAIASDTVEEPRDLIIGSKRFTESAILGEMLRLSAKVAGVNATHKRSFGSRLVFDALVQGDIDAYVEYTGTLKQELLARERLIGDEQIRASLAKRGIVMTGSLGFNNTYILGMARKRASELGITKISDLQSHPDLKFGFSSEFMDRGDGWPGLRDRYELPQQNVRGMEHDLAYRGVAEGALDVTDLYATDSKIEQFDLVPIDDDKRYFPEYQAVVLYRVELEDSHPQIVANWNRLVGRVDDSRMMRLNAQADLEKKPDTEVAASFLREKLELGVVAEVDSAAANIGRRTLEHLRLVGWSMLAAILIGLPLGVAAAKSAPMAAQSILGTVGIVQTIPSLALLVFMLPFFGVGDVPAICAMFLYSLLPIVRNTASGIAGIRPELRESAEALGLPSRTVLRRIELPLAARSILAGIKTSVVINIGTATLGAFIGAGGYGQPIFTGIQRGDEVLILQGAIPAALMALVAQGLFEIVERVFVPRGLRLPQRS